jgi:hypothetical protein
MTPVIPRSEATKNLPLLEGEILRFAQDDTPEEKELK